MIVSFVVCVAMMDGLSGRPVGVAQRRRERRLRSMLRHEQQLIRMALATVMHHSCGKVHTEYGALRGLKTATRAGEEGHEDKHDAPRRQKPPPPQPELFQLYEEEPGGRRPTGLVEPGGPQERVPRHTMEQFGELAPMVQILDAPVPQMVDQLEEVFKPFDIEVPEQDIPMRALVRGVQLAEQLVDVPVPETVILARGRSALGAVWYHVASRSGQSYHWMGGSRHVQWRRPEGFTASPGRYINTGQC